MLFLNPLTLAPFPSSRVSASARVRRAVYRSTLARRPPALRAQYILFCAAFRGVGEDGGATPGRIHRAKTSPIHIIITMLIINNNIISAS